MNTRIALALGAITVSSLLVACESQSGQPKAAASQPAAQAAAGAAGAASAGGGAPNLEEGKLVFMRTCANCHGPDGTGAMMRAMYPKIGDLTSPELHERMKDADFVNLITNGRDKMPALGGVIKPEQLPSVIAYVRTLKKG